MYRFTYIELTGLTEKEVVKRARKSLRYMEKRFGKGCMTMQQSVDSVIDAVAEYAQG